jgi:hypothetical protein
VIGMNDDEIAFRIVRLYFEDVARLGFKRSLDLDQMINAYFYVLKRLKEKESIMKKVTAEVVKEEKVITSKEVPGATKVVTTKTETTPIVKEVTTTTTVETKAK